MPDLLGLLAQPDRPVMPSEEFSRQLRRQLSGARAVGSVDGGAGEPVILLPTESPDDTDRRRAGRLVAAGVAAVVTVLALGSVALLTRSSGEESADPSIPPSTIDVPLPTEPAGPGTFDGATAVLPDGFEVVDVASWEDGFVILGTDMPPADGELPASNATLFVTDGDRVVPVVALGDRPTHVVSVGSFAWVAHFETGAVSKIDLDEGVVVDSVVAELAAPIGSGGDRRFLPNDLETGFGSVWLLTARGAVARIDQGSLDVTAVIELPTHSQDLAIGRNRVWVAQDGEALVELDPATGATAIHDLDHRGFHVVADGDVALVWGQRLDTPDTALTLAIDGEGPIERIDTGTDAHTIGTIGGRPGVLFDDGSFRDVFTTTVGLGSAVPSLWDTSSLVVDTARGLVQVAGGRVSWVGPESTGGVPISVGDATERRPIAADYVASPDWVPLAESPIVDRWPAATVWTGTEIILFAGETFGGGSAFRDGAIYDIAADEWRLMAPIPISIGSEPGWVWTGSELVVWDSSAVAAAYDPAADQWRVVEPWPLPGSFYRRAVWTGDEIIDISVRLAVDPLDGSARRIAPPPPFPERAIAIWADGLVMLSTGGPAYRPSTNEWVQTGGNTLTPLSTGAAWTGSGVVAVDYLSSVARFDPGSGSWDVLGQIPFGFGEWIPWTYRIGDTVVVESFAGVLVYRPEDDGWTHIAQPRVTDRSPRAIPAGDDLYLWDGGLHRLATPLGEVPQRVQLHGATFQIPTGWAPVGLPDGNVEMSWIVVAEGTEGPQCRIEAHRTDAWQDLSLLPPGELVEIVPVVGGEPVEAIRIAHGEETMVSWAPLSTLVVSVTCEAGADEMLVAAHAWFPWQ